jgi:hypothetical protein
VPDQLSLQDVIAQAAERFAYEIIDTLRAARIADMSTLASPEPAKRRGCLVPRSLPISIPPRTVGICRETPRFAESHPT